MHSPRFWQTCLTCIFAIATRLGAEPLSLEQAVVRSLENNPDLAAFGYEFKAQEGRVQQAGARPSIEAGVMIENALGTGARKGFDAVETTLTLGFLFEHGALQRRRDAATAGMGVINSELAIRRTDVAAETARRFITVLEDQQHINELTEARELAERTLEAVRLRVRAARVPQAEEARAEAALARATIEVEHAEHELLSARRRLAALWGELEPSFNEASGTLNALPALPSFDSLRSSLENNPEFERYVSEQRLREAELRVAELRRRPGWQLTTGMRRFEDQDDHALVLGISVPLPSRDYANGAVAQARAQLDEVDARRSARRVQLDTELFALYQDLNHSYKEVAMLRDEVLPKMARAVDESRYAYERGRYSYVEWVGAQQELLEVRRSLSTAYANVHRYRVEIERLTGASLTSRPVR